MTTRMNATHVDAHLPAVSPTELLTATPEFGRYAQDGAIIVAENFIDELQTNPSIAHLIMERFLNNDRTVLSNDAEMSLVFGDGADTHATRLARYLYFITKWMWYFTSEKNSYNDLIDMFYEDPQWTVLKPFTNPAAAEYKADLLYQNRNWYFTNHMRLLCDYVRKNMDIACECEGLKIVICQKVLEMTEVLPEFEEEAKEFLALPGLAFHNL